MCRLNNPFKSASIFRHNSAVHALLTENKTVNLKFVFWCFDTVFVVDVLPFLITSNLSQSESRYHSEFFIWFALVHHKRKYSLCFVFSHSERFWSLWFSWFQILSKAGKSSGEQDGDDNDDDDDDDDDDITNMNDDLNDQEKVNKREGKSVTLEMIKVWRSGLEVWCSVLDCKIYLCPIKCGINANVKMEVQFAFLPP